MSNDFYTPDFDSLPLFRRTDPATSKAAGKAATEFKGGHEQLILEALASGPGTKDQISSRCGLTEQQVARRMHGLRRRCLVVEVGEALSPTGNRETVYAASASAVSTRSDGES